MLKKCTKISGLTVTICVVACDQVCKHRNEPGMPMHSDKFCGLKSPNEFHRGGASQHGSRVGRLVRRFISP
ncbi:hypothetical protein KSP39_PZI023427 [Platanthera zijinensis]|uniref:Uncharacterized protein n=1 Tax=Platanthera zijinensis TaxID=2320716 RepID=A0AAP0ATJ3_9ASPA